MIRLFTLCFIFCSLSSFANSLEGFFKRFQFTRDQHNTLIQITDNTINNSFSMELLIERIYSDLSNHQKMSGKEFYQSEIEQMLFEDLWSEGYKNNHILQTIQKSLQKVAILDLNLIFNNSNFNKTLKYYESRLNNEVNKMQWNVLARPNDSQFFYKRNVGYQVVRWGLNLAKDSLATIPVFNMASYLIVKAEELIRMRREYHQNMLLHYFNNFNELDLNMTKVEVDRSYSSIYESRIPWFGYFESKNAVANWSKYGANKFFSNFRLANQSSLRAKKFYSSVDERLNYAFQNATHDDKRVIINLFNAESQFQTRPALAYYYDQPNFITMKRQVYRLAQIGLSFMTIPASLKNLVNNYINSTINYQRITEGALVAHFESTGQTELQENLGKQTINPF